MREELKACREAFEEWADAKGDWPTDKFVSGNYEDENCHAAWQGWKACYEHARTTPAVVDEDELAELLIVPMGRKLSEVGFVGVFSGDMARLAQVVIAQLRPYLRPMVQPDTDEAATFSDKAGTIPLYQALAEGRVKYAELSVQAKKQVLGDLGIPDTAMGVDELEQLVDYTQGLISDMVVNYEGEVHSTAFAKELVAKILAVGNALHPTPDTGRQVGDEYQHCFGCGTAFEVTSDTGFYCKYCLSGPQPAPQKPDTGMMSEGVDGVSYHELLCVLGEAYSGVNGEVCGLSMKAALDAIAPYLHLKAVAGDVQCHPCGGSGHEGCFDKCEFCDGTGWIRLRGINLIRESVVKALEFYAKCEIAAKVKTTGGPGGHAYLHQDNGTKARDALAALAQHSTASAGGGEG